MAVYNIKYIINCYKIYFNEDQKTLVISLIKFWIKILNDKNDDMERNEL